MKIEVVYANSYKQRILSLAVPDGTTVEEAIEVSGILKEFAEIDLKKQSVGIFGKKVTLSTLLIDGARIEIYRSLTIDPMQKRRLIAKKTEKR